MPYKADFDSFSEMVFETGIVVRRIETAGGGATYSIVAEDVSPDDFMVEEGAAGDWYWVDKEESERWLAAAQS